MDAGLIVAIVVGALILLALFVLLGRKGRDRKLEANRHEAREIRRGADVDRAQADKSRAEADVEAAEARSQEAHARERSLEAEDQQREARDRHLEAASLDPDVDEREAEERYDREQDPRGATTHGYGESDVAAPDRAREDEHVEHHERTETGDAERERHFERNDQGEVVRDEERRQPRER